jgi:hypothetical protein
MATKTETEERASASEVATLTSPPPVERKKGVLREHPVLSVVGFLVVCAMLLAGFLWWQY